MNEKSMLSSKKSLIIKAIVAVLVLGTLWVAVQNLPRGFSRDLSVIGKGSNVVVQVHDHNLVYSIDLMENLNKVRDEYADSIRFVVADLTTPEAQVFATRHGVDSVTLMFFAPDGTARGTVHGAQSPEELRNTLNQAFGIKSNL